MNPTDLLFTNSYSSTDNYKNLKPSLQHINNIKENREHIELQKYLQNELQNSVEINNIEENNIHKNEEYIDDYNTSYDVLEPPIRNPNITANLEYPQWIYDKQNISLSNSIRPVLDNTIDNVKKFRYRKYVISYINIDSRQRNLKKYPNAGNYNIFLNKEFRYLQSIHLQSIEFREAPTPINERNNCFKWITNYTGICGIKDNTRVQYKARIPSSFYSLANFVQVIENNSINRIPHNIPYECLLEEDVEINGKFPNFDIYINPFNRSIEFIQRLENLIVCKIECCKNSNKLTIYIKNPGFFKNEIPSDNCMDNEQDYPFKPIKESVPIILSGLDLFITSIGNIPISYINLIPFYPKNNIPSDTCIIYPHNTYSCLDKSYDYDHNYFIYELEIFTCDGKEVCASISDCVDFTKGSTLPNFPAGHSIQVQVGRALKFEIVTDCGGTFGNFLGLTTANKDVFIHTNIDIKNNKVINKIPWKITGTGELSIATDEYIFMRIGTRAKPLGTISDNLTCAKGDVNTNINSSIFDRKDNFFFAKIIFSDKAPGDVSILSVAGNKFFYNAPLVTLSDLTVEFFDSNGKLLNLYLNHSFTLEIVEIREVLKDTLLDSRTGNIADTGLDIPTTNPI